MDVDLQPEEEEAKENEEEEDCFLRFVGYAKSELLEIEGDPSASDQNGDGEIVDVPGWSWIVSRVLKTCVAYSSGVTPAILLSELSSVSANEIMTLHQAIIAYSVCF